MANSAWKIEKPKSYPKLQEHVSTEVVIIGGGLSGIWCAYLLSKAGKKVILIEKDEIGGAETMYTTAFITQDLDTKLSKLIEIFGESAARAAWESGQSAIECIEGAIEHEKIECEFKRSSIFQYADSSKEMKELEDEAKFMKIFGSDAQVHKKTSFGFKTAGALELKDQAKYHPMKFLYGLAEKAVEARTEIFEKTEAVEIKENRRGGIEVKTQDAHIIDADSVIIVTYDPLTDESTHLKKGMYVSYVYELSIPKGLIEEGMYLDQKNPYHYIRVDNIAGKKDRMIVGGEDHRAEIKFEEGKSFKALKEFIQKTFPTLEYEIENKWSGKILEPSDGLALIGQIAPNQYLASAFSGNGMTYAPISALIISDSILGKQNKTREEWARVFDPKRSISAKSLFEKGKDYAEEFFGGAVKNLFK